MSNEVKWQGRNLEKFHLYSETGEKTSMYDERIGGGESLLFPL